MNKLCIKRLQRHNGYTLIELLLVVTVIALIAALGLKTYRDKAQSDRINIAALSIQHVLEAGLSYNAANNGLWPKKNWDPCNSSSSVTDKVFVQTFLPNSTNQTIYGNALCWSGEDKTITNGDQKAKRFWVAMQVPGTDASSVKDTARRIAARLPNAVITSDPSVVPTSAPQNDCQSTTCYVKAEVAMPSGGGDSTKFYISAVGFCDPAKGQDGIKGSTDDSLCKKTKLSDQFSVAKGSPYANDDSLSQYEVDFTCRSGEKGSVYATPNFLQVDRFQNTYGGPLYESSVVSSKCEDPNNDGKQKCTVTLIANSGGEDPDYSKLSTPESKATLLGCKDVYVEYFKNSGAPFCRCLATATKHCGDYPGAIGASYTAVCIKQSTTLMADVAQNW